MTTTDTTASVSVGEKLLNEIERVTAKHERWKQYANECGQHASFAPAIMSMTQAINSAKRALTSMDAVECIACLRDLEGYDSND